ncbi:TetR/AcrR family transcriptional regulator [Pontibacillus salicampi]|uniref:TetR/AcrR family transcriptional regulator n=1 Tax=Pontibacillus salicampi TaxID=1449801 RepID=A0ABV6LLT4_9BACI
MNGFEKRTKMKKDNILSTAFHLFANQGLQQVSIQHIAKEAEVSQVTIYNYFGSKDQLFIEAVKHYAISKMETFQEMLENEELTFEDKIKELIAIKQDSMSQLNLEVIQALISDKPELEEFMQEFTEQYSLPSFLTLLDQGKAEGYIKQDISLEMLMFYIDMYSQAVRKRQDMFESHEAIQQFTEQTLNLFFYGLTGK